MWKKIKHWYWWNFKATEKEKVDWDTLMYGTGFMKNGKRIDPKKFIINGNVWENPELLKKKI